MLSGRRLDLLNPSPLDVEIEDIAHGLARVARWNGQTIGEHAFSVAQHCLLVEALVGRLVPSIERRWRLAALLHDAPEYVIGDMITPFKTALGLDYRGFEAALAAAVHVRFGLPPALPAHAARPIKRADRVAAFLEARRLAGFGEAEARRYFGRPRDLAAVERIAVRLLKPWPAGQAQCAFVARFAALAQAGATPRAAAP